MSSKLSYLLYVSEESRPLQQADFDSIINVCSVNNKERNITGMLLYIEGRFFQVLEGETEAINDLYNTISKDDRHKNATVIARGDLDKRIFKGWTMKFSSISEKEFAAISGVSRFKNLFSLKPKDPQNPAWLFVKKFTDKTFPSESWWAA